MIKFIFRLIDLVLFSAKMGLKEDIDDIIREEAEKKKKRPKLSTK